MNDDTTFAPSITYRDPKAATTWLQEAFGFVLTMAIEGPDGNPSDSHYEMAAPNGRGRVMVGGEWSDTTVSPLATDGRVTQSVHVALDGDVDAHCARAVAAGATIVVEPADQFYGDRVYRCHDLEGQHWVFSAKVRDVTRAEAEAAIGVPIHAPDWA